MNTFVSIRNTLPKRYGLTFWHPPKIFFCWGGMVFACLWGMPRKHLKRISDCPYHVTARTNHKTFFELPMPEVDEIITNWLNLTHFQMDARTHHFKLMSNHFHWLLSTPQENLDQIMWLFLKGVTDEINARLDRKGHLWGGPYFYTLLDTPSKYFFTVKYTYRNAVRAGIVQRVEHYPYSTLNAYFGFHPCKIFISEEINSRFRMPVQFSFLDWLNEPFSDGETVEIGKCLTRSQFKFTRITRTKRFEIANPWVEGSD